jgi:hypothetical protein
MRKFLANLLSIPFAIIGYPFLLMGLILLVAQVFWWLYLGQWFSAGEIVQAIKLSGKISVRDVLQYGSLDTQYLHSYFISSGALDAISWPGLKKFVSWAISFHPLVTGLIFASPAYLIHVSLGVKVPE